MPLPGLHVPDYIPNTHTAILILAVSALHLQGLARPGLDEVHIMGGHHDLAGLHKREVPVHCRADEARVALVSLAAAVKVDKPHLQLPTAAPPQGVGTTQVPMHCTYNGGRTTMAKSREGAWAAYRKQMLLRSWGPASRTACYLTRLT